MNFITAIVLLVIVNILGVTIAVDDTVTFSENARVSPAEVAVASVAEEGPADQAGFHIGDRIIAVNGQQLDDVDSTVALIGGAAGTSTNITISRGSEIQEILVVPRINPPEGQGAVGIQLMEVSTVRFPWYQAIWEGTKQSVIMTGQIFVIFVGIIRDLIATGSVTADIAGPVGIAVITGQVLEMGIVPLLQFTALLSINLAIINALPFPALDGGRLLFILIEKIRRKKVSKRVENALHTIGFGLLIAIVLIVTFRDITRFF